MVDFYPTGARRRTPLGPCPCYSVLQILSPPSSSFSRPDAEPGLAQNHDLDQGKMGASLSERGDAQYIAHEGEGNHSLGKNSRASSDGIISPVRIPPRTWNVHSHNTGI